MKNKLFYLGIGLMSFGLLCIFYLSSRISEWIAPVTFPVGLVGFLVGFLLFRRSIELVSSERRDRLVKKSFLALDVVRSGKRWLGTESEIVKTLSIIWTERARVQYQVLCLTKRGAWFVYLIDVTVSGARVIRESLDPADSELAQNALLDDRELFAKYFNVPDIDIA